MTDIIEDAARVAEENIKKRKIRRELPKPRSVKEVAKERRVERALEKIAPKTGIEDLDKIIKGFIPGHIYTITGGENVGKTSLACNFAVSIEKQEKRVLYFALEPENTVVDYIASVRFGKKFDDLTQEDLEYDDGFIKIFGKEEVRTLRELVQIVKETTVHYDVIVIDHFGYFIHGENNYIQEQSNAVKTIAGLTKSKNVAIINIVHLRKRTTAQKKNYAPTSDDIAGSGAFKQDSTEVIIVVRNFVEEEGSSYEYEDRGRLYVTKTKCGPNGAVDIVFSDRSAKIMSSREADLLEREESDEDGGINWWKK